MADRKDIRTPKTGHNISRCMALAALVPLTLAGCAGQPMQMGSTIKSVPVEQAMVMPPPAGPGIVSVIERRYDNAIDQEIHLFTSALTPGQNMLKAQFFGTTAAFRLSSNNLTSTPVTEAGIATEMRQALPGVRMVRSQFYVQNSYGPFGYAFGRSAGTDLCIYGWQQIRSPTGTISPFSNYGSIQIRVRVCESGATEQKLLAIMYNYTILGAVDAQGWNPYGEPGPVSPTLGGIGSPTYPRPAGNEPIVPVLPQRQSVLMRPAMATSSVTAERPVREAPVVSRTSSQLPAPADPAMQAGQTTPLIPSPVVPSPTGSPATSRVVVPSPSCALDTGGADAACR
jgi:hypothetical protein